MRKGKYLVGLFYILLVNLLWASSAFLIDGMFEGYPSPFLVTYCQNCFFLLPLVFYIPMLWTHCITTRNRREKCSLLGTKPKSIGCSEKKSDVWLTETVPEAQVGQDTVAVDSSNREVWNDKRIDQKQPDRNEKPTSWVKDNDGVTCCFCCIVQQSRDRFTLLDTARHSGTLCLIWFIMIYSYNVSLRYTSFASGSLLSMCSGPFCLIFSVLLLKESLDLRKIVGQAAVIVGIILIMECDGKYHGYVLGDVVAALSAFVYACFSTLMAFRLKKDGNISMYLFLGLIGFFNMICLWPLFFIFDFTGVELLRLPDKSEILALTVAGFMNLISNHFWTRSILLTSPFIATLGLSLYIPMVLIIDFLNGNIDNVYNKLYLLGSGCIVTGFVLVNLKAKQNLEQDIGNKQSLNTVLQEALLNKSNSSVITGEN